MEPACEGWLWLWCEVLRPARRFIKELKGFLWIRDVGALEVGVAAWAGAWCWGRLLPKRIVRRLL